MKPVKRLWNKNFSILWSGQLVSDFGNAAFSVALGFWVLEMTKTAAMPGGNTALMGLILACFALPNVLLGPVAGAFADRHDRKRIIVLTDCLRGVLFALFGVTVLLKVFPFYMIFPLAILEGSLASFFSPAMSSSIPDIVPTDDLTRANSARSFSSTLTQLMGNSLGGVLYAMLTAPVLILFNGLSFLFASFAQLFMAVPKHAASRERKHIFHDVMEGIRYTFSNRGIRTLVLTGMLINFFAVCGTTMLTPLFNSEPGFGKEMYGLAMGTLMAGAIVGMLVLSILKLKPSMRSSFFSVAMMVMVTAMVPFGLVRNVAWMFPLAFIAGLSNAIVNVLIQTVMQVTVPSENRGKVFGILGTVMGGLQPIAMAASGAIAQVVGLRPTIVGSFAIMVLAVLPLLFDRSFKRFINTEVKPDVNEETAVPAEIASPSPEES